MPTAALHSNPTRMNLRWSSHLFAVMGFFGLTTSATSKRAGAAALSVAAAGGGAAAASSSSTPSSTQQLAPLPGVEDRLRRALWAFFAGDAVAAPTHWFYGGQRQVQEYYGPRGITGYTKPSFNLAGSILNKSDPTGGGRAKFGSAVKQKSIIGDVINHGKLDLWSPSKQVNYHATLAAGENTLEGQLARVLMRSITETGGDFNPDHFRDAYVKFMTTPGSHNDTYASTCHRMFFANMVYKNLDPKDCPDNDGHNVDTVDGLVLPTIVGLAAAARATANRDCSVESALEDAAKQSSLCAGVTRRSTELNRAAAGWGQLVAESLWYGPERIQDSARDVARSLGLRQPKVVAKDEMTACYLSSALPALLDSVVTNDSKRSNVWSALLRNANTGGENVHRGSCLGAVLGAASRETELDPQMVQDLHDREQLNREIEQFVSAVLNNAKDSSGSNVELEL